MEFLIIFIAGLAAGVHFTKKYQFNKYAVHIGEQIVTDVLKLSLSEDNYALLSNVTELLSNLVFGNLIKPLSDRLLSPLLRP